MYLVLIHLWDINICTDPQQIFCTSKETAVKIQRSILHNFQWQRCVFVKTHIFLRNRPICISMETTTIIEKRKFKIFWNYMCQYVHFLLALTNIHEFSLLLQIAYASFLNICFKICQLGGNCVQCASGSVWKILPLLEIWALIVLMFSQCSLRILLMCNNYQLPLCWFFHWQVKFRQVLLLTLCWFFHWQVKLRQVLLLN